MFPKENFVKIRRSEITSEVISRPQIPYVLKLLANRILIVAIHVLYEVVITDLHVTYCM